MWEKRQGPDVPSNTLPERLLIEKVIWQQEEKL